MIVQTWKSDEKMDFLRVEVWRGDFTWNCPTLALKYKLLIFSAVLLAFKYGLGHFPLVQEVSSNPRTETQTSCVVKESNSGVLKVNFLLIKPNIVLGLYTLIMLPISIWAPPSYSTGLLYYYIKALFKRGYTFWKTWMVEYFNGGLCNHSTLV